MKIRYLTLWIFTCALLICVYVLLKREPVLMCVGILIVVGISFKISYEVMASFRRSVEERAKSILEETKKIQNMRSEFVANASHELKTPLTSISGFIETLQSGAVEDEETRNKFINIIGAFPNASAPRVVWLGVGEGGKALKNLAERVDFVSGECGFPLEKRAFKAHLSIARSKEGDRVPAPLLFLLENLPPLVWRCGSFSLMQSELTREGPIYTPVEVYLLD